MITNTHFLLQATLAGVTLHLFHLLLFSCRDIKMHQLVWTLLPSTICQYLQSYLLPVVITSVLCLLIHIFYSINYCSIINNYLSHLKWHITISSHLWNSYNSYLLEYTIFLRCHQLLSIGLHFQSDCLSILLLCQINWKFRKLVSKRIPIKKKLHYNRQLKTPVGPQMWAIPQH